jgi:peptidoglycan/xylan/chitin deacetylase (PgdA/CDA1 family)
VTAAARALVPIARTVARRTSVILCYHGIGRTTASTDPDFLRVDPDAFRTQLEILTGAGFELVTVADLVARMNGGAPPPGLAAISFDDGLDDNHDVALPILREFGAPATVYVVSGMIGQPNPWLDPSLGCRMMTEDELRTLAAAGFELGAHTVTHPDLSQLDYDACLDELVRSREAIERIQGRPVRTFAYPFCRYGDAAVAAAEAAGFDAAVTCHERGGWTRYELARPMITGKDGLTSFALKLAGAYYPLFHSPPGRLVRASTRELRRRVRARSEAA